METKMKQRHLIHTVACVFVIAALSLGQSIVLEVDKDAYICDCEPDANNPGGPITKLFQGPYYVSGHKCYARTASSWDLSNLPTGCNISQATIEFKCTSTYGTLTGQMVFYRFIQNWGETTITSNKVPSYTSQDSIVISWPSAGQWLSIDVTKIVRFWNEHPDSNFGIFGHCANATANNGAVEFNSSRFSTSADRPKLTIIYSTTDVKTEGTLLPSGFRLEAYPNPFNPNTTISYMLDKAGQVSLNVMDLNGRIVDHIVNAYQSTGEHHIQWNASRFSSGIYLVTLTSGNKQTVKKVTLMK
jgi:hypothetical protein